MQYAKNANFLVAQYDQTDPSVSSVNGSNPYLTRINYIGDVNWASPGQRLTWNVEVPKAGYYKLAFRYKQSHVLNGNAYRKLLINGEVPFAEAANMCFKYDLDWKHMVFGDDKGNPYLIYLNEGDNTISMEVNVHITITFSPQLRGIGARVNSIYITLPDLADSRYVVIFYEVSQLR